MIQFLHNGFTYRTNNDASIVEGHDGKKWNRTHSLGVRDAALQAIELRQIGERIGTRGGTYKPPWLVTDDKPPKKSKKSSRQHSTMANSNGNGKKSGGQLDREINDILRARQKREGSKPAPASRSGVPSQAEYERRELSDAHKKLDQVGRAPLADRKEAQGEFLEAMRDHPEIVGERVGWLLDGNYGYGSMLLAKRVLASPRMNRSAALTQMVGAFEWQSPEDMTRAAWKKLSASEKARLESEVQAAISSAESEE
jgi:hypothetical protein